MALSSAVVTANLSFWTGAKVAFPAPVVAPDPEFPEPDEHPVINAESAVNAANAESAASVPGLADLAARSFGRRGEVGLVPARSRSFSLVLARSDRFMFPVTKD